MIFYSSTCTQMQMCENSDFKKKTSEYASFTLYNYFLNFTLRETKGKEKMKSSVHDEDKKIPRDETTWEQKSIEETKKMVEIYKREKANGFLRDVEIGKWVVLVRESWCVFDDQMKAIEWGLETAQGSCCPLVLQLGFENLYNDVLLGL